MPSNFHAIRSVLATALAPHEADRHAGAILRAASGRPIEQVLEDVARVMADPAIEQDNDALAGLARRLLELRHRESIVVRDEPLGYSVFGEQGIEPGARRQMDDAMRLGPVVAGALMPDAHQGYALPIGGVIAVEDALIPYAVGVDIGCRMHLSVFHQPAEQFDALREGLRRAILHGTHFGQQTRSSPLDHPLLDDPRFRETEKFMRTSGLRERCALQFGSSGGGNHFVEFGELHVTHPDAGIPSGRWMALLSHSGSRALGHRIATAFTAVAKRLTPLPTGLEDFAWLPLGTEEGRAYLAAMELAGDFSAANHRVIHETVIAAAGLDVALSVSNHHNYAWREKFEGRDVYVHRKGATPASRGALGVIPGSMATPGFLVRGLSGVGSLESASHGAGRRMSRREAERTITSAARDLDLASARVELLGGGIDEAPSAYKDIHSVMAAQTGLVEVLAEFHPRIVRMAGRTELDPEEGN
ncbi:MAG: RtcB family protein [Verrucomicrobiota bacterium]